MGTTTFRRGDVTGAHTLVLLQAVICIVVGAVLVAMPTLGWLGLAFLLGLYWTVRGIATVGHAHVEPGYMAGKGLVAALTLVAGVVALQAPLFGVFEIGVSIVLFLGLQAMVSGVIEMVVGSRDNAHGISILGLTNFAIGLALIMYPLVPMSFLTAALGGVAIVGGLLAAYATIVLPRDVITAMAICYA